MKYRIYFNRKEDYPCIWSVDEGSSATEIRVQWFSIDKLNVWAQHGFGPQPHNTPERSENDPDAWIEVEGYADFQGGGVIFKESK